MEFEISDLIANINANQVYISSIVGGLVGVVTGSASVWYRDTIREDEDIPRFLFLANYIVPFLWGTINVVINDDRNTVTQTTAAFTYAMTLRGSYEGSFHLFRKIFSYVKH